MKNLGLKKQRTRFEPTNSKETGAHAAHETISTWAIP
jgi:hypothetical protein